MEKNNGSFKNKYMCNRKRGFILLRTLISLVITFTMIIILLNSLKVLSNYDNESINLQEEISSIQLIRLLSMSYDLKVSHNEIYFNLEENNWNIKYLNNNVILQPGTQTYFFNVDDVYFNIESNLVYINYSRNDKQYKRVIGYV